jgi:hypothetical protein
MSANNSIVIDLIYEGPDIEELGLYKLITNATAKFDYDLKKLQIVSCNTVQSGLDIDIKINAPTHFVTSTQDQMSAISKDIKKTFGMFIGRSNAHRLYLSSYLWNRYKDQAIQTFHYDPENDFHKDNLGFDQLINQYGTAPAVEVANFLQHTPLYIEEKVTYPILMDQHCGIKDFYKDFFVEIVCETYYSGQTFFPTEKIWRAIASGTPFIVQGPQYCLHHLRDLGFRTFSHYWDEGYAEDPANHQPYEIVKLMDRLGAMPLCEITAMYHDMKSILDHNCQQFQALTSQDFKELTNEYK